MQWLFNCIYQKDILIFLSGNSAVLQYTNSSSLAKIFIFFIHLCRSHRVSSYDRHIVIVDRRILEGTKLW